LHLMLQDIASFVVTLVFVGGFALLLIGLGG
jgi:hypothetical protein